MSKPPRVASKFGKYRGKPVEELVGTTGVVFYGREDEDTTLLPTLMSHSHTVTVASAEQSRAELVARLDALFAESDARDRTRRGSADPFPRQEIYAARLERFADSNVLLYAASGRPVDAANATHAGSGGRCQLPEPTAVPRAA